MRICIRPEVNPQWPFERSNMQSRMASVKVSFPHAHCNESVDCFIKLVTTLPGAARLAGERANCLSLVRVLCGPTRRADGDIGVGRIGLSSYLQYANYLFPFLVRSRDLASEVTALWACSPHFPATNQIRYWILISRASSQCLH